MGQRNGSSTSSIAGDRLEEITATHVNVEKSAVRHVDADVAQLEKAAVQRLRARTADFERSSVAFASVNSATIKQSNVGAVVGKSVACDEVRTGILVAPMVRGDVHTWFDLRTAFAIGLGMALGRALIGGGRALAGRARR
ncbi:MAG: hypothetical protein M0R74_07250 [Dehalococcoidia bacterium]|nr:hypothetical protein [Dehalococcoidia bacterium]